MIGFVRGLTRDGANPTDVDVKLSLLQSRTSGRKIAMKSAVWPPSSPWSEMPCRVKT